MSSSGFAGSGCGLPPSVNPNTLSAMPSGSIMPPPTMAPSLMNSLRDNTGPTLLLILGANCIYAPSFVAIAPGVATFSAHEVPTLVSNITTHRSVLGERTTEVAPLACTDR